MTPAAAVPASDEAIDALIDRMKPEIRKALRAILEQGRAVDSFTCLEQRTKPNLKLVMFIAHEAPAALLAKTAEGIQEMGAIYARLIPALAALNKSFRKDTSAS